MTIELSDSLIKAFESEVHHQFQSAGKLRNVVRVKSVQGNQVQFPVMNKGTAAARGTAQSALSLMDVAHAPVTISMSNFVASDLTDIFQQAQVNFDERQELVKTIANALARRMDQIIIDGLVAATITNTVAADISGSSDNLTLAAIREAARLLDTANVGSGERALVIHASGLHHLLADTTVTSADHNSVRALMAGDLDTFYGFKVVTLGDMAEGGLPLSSGARTNFAFRKEAVGVGINLERIEVNYEPGYASWRVTGFLSAGAGVIDPTGVVEITTAE